MQLSREQLISAYTRMRTIREFEERLKAELDIPVFHDDQHGTAIVLLAALLNALKIVKKELHELKVVVCGIGSAGMACSKMMLEAGVKNIIGFIDEIFGYKGKKTKYLKLK